MQIISDLQVHSKYSRAVSKYMDMENINEWCIKKGIDLVTTGDWQHPKWFHEIKDKLVEVDSGVFQLKEQRIGSKEQNTKNVKFMLVTEISSIYKDKGKTRKIHNLLFSPSIETCEKIIKELEIRGANLRADGRPIIGLSSKALLELCLSIDENILFIPAHVWTPWFGLFGSKSGYDSIEECFEDFSEHIYAIETGLSSDPRMNWQIKDLDKRSIVSFSDAHSGAKLGREATVFKVQRTKSKDQSYSYFEVVNAIKQKSDSRLKIDYTIEFFPEEGKYHLSGHRAHGIVYLELDLREKGPICPFCKKELTIGVEHRICSLSDKVIEEKDMIYEKDDAGLTFIYDKDKKRIPYVSTIPLLEIITDVIKSKVKSEREYENIVKNNSEFDILLKLNYNELNDAVGSQIADAIMKVRNREVEIEPGYDGVFGKIKLPGHLGHSGQIL